MKLSLIDKFGDWCLKQPLLELASERMEHILKIKELSNPLNEHLFNIYSMSESTYLSHWIDEIDNFLFQIYNKKCGKKKFDPNDYYKWLFIDYFYGSEENYLKNNQPNFISKINKRLDKMIENQYCNELVINHNFNEFVQICERFYKLITLYLNHAYENLEIELIINEYFSIK